MRRVLTVTTVSVLLTAATTARAAERLPAETRKAPSADGQASAAIRLVEDHQAAFAIYHDRDAPSSVAMAAVELQEYLDRVSGAKAPIVHQPHRPMISLGENAASAAAGLSAENLPSEGFRIVTRRGNLYILGPDTADGRRTAGGGTSTGTRNGTYALIERFLGVRWLVPGEHGDYVPKKANVSIAETDWTDAPCFLNRRLPYTQQHRPEVKRWWARQRLGWSLYLNHSHNWRRTIPASEFDGHPNWFAEHGGVRVPPTGRYKLCTTNRELVRAYAEAAIRFFDEHPETTCYSLSPSDSAGYCECEKCSALYETDPNGDRSVTPAVLTFYNDVARLVARKYPHKRLAGYVYAAYVFPPREAIPLEPNVFLVWAPSFDYGYTLFRPSLQQQWDSLLGQWTQATRNVSYYDLPTHVLTDSGALNPPGLKILKFIYPRLKAAGVKGVYVYGIEAWGRAAPLNYLLAKLAWDPEADVGALFEEFCAKAYGPGGAEISRMFRLLDAEMERYFLEHAEARYRPSTDMMRGVYAKNWDRIEQLYRAAESEIRDADAMVRLKMIGENLTVLHWHLRQMQLLENPRQSHFYLSDADFFRFLREHRGSLALQPSAMTSTPSYVGRRLRAEPADRLPGAVPVRAFRLRGDQHLLLCPSGRQRVKVKFSRVTTRGKLVTYGVYRPGGKEIASGLVSAETPLEFDPGGADYYHLVISADIASLMVEVDGAAWAADGSIDAKGLHLLGHVTPVYFHVPEGLKGFELSLAATPPGETARATLYAPDGRATAEFDCSRVAVDRRRVAVPAGAAGWWTVKIAPAATGALDDVWLKPGRRLSGWFSLVPGQALRVAFSRSNQPATEKRE